MKQHRMKVLAASGALAVVALIVLAVSRYVSTAAELTTFEGVKIGDSRAEVLYRKGEPKIVFGPLESASDGVEGPGGWGSWQHVYYVNPDEDPSENKVNVIPNGKTIDDFDDWSYSTSGLTAAATSGDVAVTFVKGNVATIRCLNFGGRGACSQMVGVEPTTSEEELLRIFGEPSSAKIDKDSGVKTMRFDDVGVEVLLRRGAVYAVEISGPKATGFNWRVLRLAALAP